MNIHKMFKFRALSRIFVEFAPDLLGFYGPRHGSAQADTKKTCLNGSKLHLFWHSSVKFLLSESRERFHIKMLCSAARQYRYFIFLYRLVSGQIKRRRREKTGPDGACGVRNTQETRDKTILELLFRTT
jgi:hypothetical protein